MDHRFYLSPLVLAVGLFISVSAAPLKAEPVTRAALLANACAACHGTDGKSPGAIPSISGKPKSFLEQALKDFRSGKRDSTIMGRHAKGYGDEDIRLLAEYFASK